MSVGRPIVYVGEGHCGCHMYRFGGYKTVLDSGTAILWVYDLNCCIITITFRKGFARTFRAAAWQTLVKNDSDRNVKVFSGSVDANDESVSLPDVQKTAADCVFGAGPVSNAIFSVLIQCDNQHDEVVSQYPTIER